MIKFLKNIRKFSVLKTVCISVASMICTMIYAVAYAGVYAGGNDTTANGFRSHFTSTNDNLMMAIILIATVAGAAYISMGALSFKASYCKESSSASQTNQNLQKGFIKLILGGCLITIPFIIHVSNSALKYDKINDQGIQIPASAYAQSKDINKNININTD